MNNPKILAFCLALASLPLQAGETPIIFARSGQKITLPVGGDNGKTGKPVSLWAFGQRWGEPVRVKNNAAEFVAPKVRVPVVFRLGPVRDSKVVFSELVVYPDRPAHWDKDTQLLAVGIPDWFDTWSEAVGLPIKKFKDLAALDAGNWQMPDKPKLLILGRKTAGNALAAAQGLTAEHEINVLVLEADWFDDAAGSVAVGGDQIRGDLLARTGKQSWAATLEFRSHRRPAGALANRWMWTADKENLPLVEKLAVVSASWSASHCVVASYLPWQEQLGRQEMADAILLDLLAAAANASANVCWRRVDIVWPKMDVESARQRPVISVAANAAVVGKDASRSVYVLDLRGGKRSPDGLLPALKALEKRIGAQTDALLILGDDKFLDAWQWLKLDRAKKTSQRPGVAWLSDGDLPPSTKTRIRLMLTLSELGVPLAEPGQEEKEP